MKLFHVRFTSWSIIGQQVKHESTESTGQITSGNRYKEVLKTSKLHSRSNSTCCSGENRNITSRPWQILFLWLSRNYQSLSFRSLFIPGGVPHLLHGRARFVRIPTDFTSIWINTGRRIAGNLHLFNTWSIIDVVFPQYTTIVHK